MSIWNVFKMELYKNWQDRVSLFIMLAFMTVNVIGGLLMVSGNWSAMGIFPFSFSVFASMIFLFIYPYRMARVDYKNRVMSLLIASGVSRVQYYFVKVGGTLVFSLLSLVMIAILPLFVVLLAEEGLMFAVEAVGYMALELNATTLGIIILGWLAAFSMLMTSVIISRGRGFAIFVFLGLYLVTYQVVSFIFRRGGISTWWWNPSSPAIIIMLAVTAVVMGLIGILVLRRQDL